MATVFGTPILAAAGASTATARHAFAAEPAVFAAARVAFTPAAMCAARRLGVTWLDISRCLHLTNWLLESCIAAFDESFPQTQCAECAKLI